MAVSACTGLGRNVGLAVALVIGLSAWRSVAEEGPGNAADDGIEEVDVGNRLDDLEAGLGRIVGAVRDSRFGLDRAGRGARPRTRGRTWDAAAQPVVGVARGIAERVERPKEGGP